MVNLSKTESTQIHEGQRCVVTDFDGTEYSGEIWNLWPGEKPPLLIASFRGKEGKPSMLSFTYTVDSPPSFSWRESRPLADGEVTPQLKLL